MLLKMKSVSNFCCNTISYILIYSVAINCFFSEEELPVCLPAKSLQLCPILATPMDCSPPGSSGQGLLYTGTLEWVAMPFSRESSRPRDCTHVSYASCIGRQVLYC